MESTYKSLVFSVAMNYKGFVVDVYLPCLVSEASSFNLVKSSKAVLQVLSSAHIGRERRYTDPAR